MRGKSQNISGASRDLAPSNLTLAGTHILFFVVAPSDKLFSGPQSNEPDTHPLCVGAAFPSHQRNEGGLSDCNLHRHSESIARFLPRSDVFKYLNILDESI